MKTIQLHNQRFDEALQAFIQRKKDEGKSKSHITSVGNHSKEFLCFLEQKEVYLLKKITQTNIDDYFQYLSARKNQRKTGGLSSAYINKHREAVLRFMEYLYQCDIGKSPFHVRTLNTSNKSKEVLTQQEIKLLFSLCEPTFEGIRNKAILSMLYGCGMRKSELHRLNVNDINMLNDTVRIVKTKNTWQRDIPMSPSVRKNIEDYLYTVRNYLIRPSKETDAFLITNIGARMSKESIHSKIKKMEEVSNIQKPISAHQLRHAIATHLLEEFTLDEIALFLGHRSIDSSQIYTHYKYTKTPTP